MLTLVNNGITFYLNYFLVLSSYNAYNGNNNDRNGFFIENILNIFIKGNIYSIINRDYIIIYIIVVTLLIIIKSVSFFISTF
jgi:hypothetical protein